MTNYSKYFELLNKEEEEEEDLIVNDCKHFFLIEKETNNKVCENCGLCKELLPTLEVDENYLWKYYSTHYIKKKHRYYFVDKNFMKRVKKSSLKNDEKYKLIKLYNINSTKIKEAYLKNGRKNINYNYLIIKLLKILNIVNYNKNEFSKNNSISTKIRNDKIFNDIKLQNF